MRVLSCIICVTLAVVVVDGDQKLRKCMRCLNRCHRNTCSAKPCEFPPTGLKANRPWTPFTSYVEDRDYTFNYFATYSDKSVDPTVGIQPVSTLVDFESDAYAAFRYPGVFSSLNGDIRIHPMDEWQRLHDFCRSSCANQTYGYLAWGASDRDPVRWNGQCQTGTKQSPIDIPRSCINDSAPSAGTLELFGFDTPFDKYGVVNDGTKIEYFMPPEAIVRGDLHIKLDGVLYNTTRWHIHWPGEHAVGGRRGLLEKHLIHEGPNGQYVVMAHITVLETTGDPSKLYVNWDPMAAAILQAGMQEPGVDLNFTRVRPTIFPTALLTNSSYYRYEGSLTTPPCSENVTWLVSTEMRYISEDAWKVFKNTKRCATTEVSYNGTRVVGVTNHIWGNARTIQPLNGREIGVLRFQPS